jgi:uncharacterized GH25 family protein
MKHRLLAIAFGLVFFVLSATCVSAHMFWLNTSTHTPQPDETVFVEIGFGHSFPRDQLIQEAQIAEVYALGPNGQKKEVQEIFPTFYALTPSQEGCYQVVARMKPGYVSKTPGGMKLGNKKDTKNALSCFRFDMTATALLKVGDSAQGYSQKNASPLQLIPMKQPEALQNKDFLPIKVLFKGKPQANVTVMTTYVGYTDHWVYEKTSNEKGIVRFELNHQGPWLIRAKYNRPYPDTSVCDEYAYSSCLTIGF